MPRTNPWWKGMGKREGVILTRRRRDAEISAEKRRSQQRGRARRQRRMVAFGAERTRFPREDQKQSRWGAMDSLHRLGTRGGSYSRSEERRVGKECRSR